MAEIRPLLYAIIHRFPAMRDCGKAMAGISPKSYPLRRKYPYSRKCAHEIQVLKKVDPRTFPGHSRSTVKRAEKAEYREENLFPGSFVFMAWENSLEKIKYR